MVHVLNKSLVSPLLNGMLHYQYAVSALKINIENKILCFCLEKSKMYLVLNIIWFLYENCYNFFKNMYIFVYAL